MQMAATSQQLIEKLMEIGYPNVEHLDTSSIDFLFHNKRLEPLLNWICHGISAANIIPPDELIRFRDLAESGAKILEVEEHASVDSNFHKVLADQLILEKQAEGQAEEIKLKLEKSSMQKRLNENLKQSLITRQSALSEEILQGESALLVAQRQLEQVIVDSESANLSMNAAGQSVDNLLRNAFDLLRPTMPLPLNAWFFDLDFQPFWRTVDEITQDVLVQIQKRFKEGNLEQIRSLEKSKQWLKILRERQLKCELTSYRTQAECEGLKAELDAAHKILDDMDFKSWKSHFLSDVSIQRLKQLERENVEFFETQILPRLTQKCDLIRDCIAASQNPTELERIAETTTILQAVISELCDIKARICLISAAFALEQEFLTGIRTFMDNLNENNQIEVQRFKSRKLMVTDLCSKLPYPSAGFEQDAASLVKVLELDDLQVLPTEKLAAVNNQQAKMDDKQTAMKEVLDSKLNQEVSLLTEMDRSLNLLTSFVWQDCAMLTVLPPLTPPTIAQALHEISHNLDKAGARFVEAIEEQQNKMVMLRADSSKEVTLKRKLYSYFYVDYDSFKLAIKALGYNKTKRPSVSEEEA